jgi:hypothetical protein
MTDQIDILALATSSLDAAGIAFDWEYIDLWARRLGIADDLEAVRA